MDDRFVFRAERCVFFALALGCFLGHRGQRSARKHRDGGPASLSHGWFNDVSLQEYQFHFAASLNGLSSFHIISKHDSVTQQTWPCTTSFLCASYLDALPCCACCTTVRKESVCHDWPQLQALFTASQHSGSPESYVARHCCTPPRWTCCFLAPS